MLLVHLPCVKYNWFKIQNRACTNISWQERWAASDTADFKILLSVGYIFIKAHRKYPSLVEIDRFILTTCRLA